MQRFTQWLAAAAALAVLASPALAQRRGGGMGMAGVFLLAQKSVQEELKLTDEQVKKVEDAMAKQREARQGLRDLDQEERTKKVQELAKDGEKTVAAILTKDQAKRFTQISLQTQGFRAFTNAAVVKELKITEEQTKQIQAMGEQVRDELARIREDAADPQEAAQKGREYLKGVNEKAMKILTAEQKAQWKEMTGEPFKGQIRFGRPQGGNSN